MYGADCQRQGARQAGPTLLAAGGSLLLELGVRRDWQANGLAGADVSKYGGHSPVADTFDGLGEQTRSRDHGRPGSRLQPFVLGSSAAKLRFFLASAFGRKSSQIRIIRNTSRLNRGSVIVSMGFRSRHRSRQLRRSGRVLHEFFMDSSGLLQFSSDIIEVYELC
jgi:hypothetical protein